MPEVEWKGPKPFMLGVKLHCHNNAKGEGMLWKIQFLSVCAPGSKWNVAICAGILSLLPSDYSEILCIEPVDQKCIPQTGSATLHIQKPAFPTSIVQQISGCDAIKHEAPAVAEKKEQARSKCCKLISACIYCE